MNISQLFSGASVSTIGMAAALATYPVLASAQEATSGPVEAEASAETGGGEIIVTGSRIGRTSFNAPTPVNVVGQDRVQDLAITNVGDALNQIPSFRPLTSPATNAFRSGTNIGARTLDLRGLGPQRTLTLIDGRRNVPSSDENTFDLNSIPSILVQRSEVVTGGASAAYGADAVAGVVNLILDTKLDGVKGEVSYGISEYGDARNIYAAFAAGTPFAAGRGHLVVGAEYADENGTGDYSSRDWSKRYHSFIPNPFFNIDPTKSNGQPANVATDNVLYVLNPGGLISTANHPFQGLQFDSGGNLVPFQFGELFRRSNPSTLMVGGDPSVQDIYGFNNTPLVVPTRNYSLLANLEYELTDTITASAQVSYSNVQGETAAATHTDQLGAVRIQRDNAFLNPSVAAMMDAAKVTFIPISRAHLELGNSSYLTENKTLRAFFALKGETFGDWRWDAYYQYGQTDGRQEGTGLRLAQRWRDAIDAVRAPAGVPGIAQGTIICRTTIANPTNGCVPANIMGPDKVSDAAAVWATGNSWQTRKFVQHNVAGNLRGTLLEGWAGPILAAVGVEYRTNSSEGAADPVSLAGQFSQITANALPPLTQKVTEGYAEVNVPLFKDSPLGQSLEVDGAIRRTHYSLSGNATTWKVGAVYELNDEYMLRVTRSRDIRAPTPQELNPNTRVANSTLADPILGTQYVIPAITGGNPDLELEKGNTFTIGAVFRPEWLPRFRLSLDYYDIKVSGAIDILTSSLAVQLCRDGTTLPICTIGTDTTIAPPNTNRILQINTKYRNVAELNAEGFELVSTYSVPLAGGDLNFTLNGSYVKTLNTTLPNGSVQEFAGVTGNSGSVTTIFGVPRWRADGVITYEQPTWSVTTQLRYIPTGILNRNWIGPQDEGYSPYIQTRSVSDNRIDDRIYVNLNARVDLTENVEVFGGIANLFDKDPPSNLRYTGNGLYFDSVGRFYKMGVRANF